MLDEVWKAVPEYEGFYEVSNFGRLRSLDRTFVNQIGQTRSYRGKLIAQCLNKRTGYLQASLKKSGVERKVRIQTIVAEAFLGPKPTPDHHVCHNDGNGTNNRIENLRYDTPKGNNSDKYLHGTIPIGVKHPQNILTEENVRDVKRRLSERQTQQSIADFYGVSRGCIKDIKSGKNWSWLK